MKTKKPRIGDVFEISLSDGRKAYGQYVFWDQENGPIVRIFDLIADDQVDLSSITNRSLLFPPIVVGLMAAIKSGLWKIIGNIAINDFDYPYFISAMYHSLTNKMGMWYLWDGADYKPLGYKLPDEYKRFEQLVVWAADDIRKRIETGVNPIDNRLDL